jgi:hypothetical protein
MPAFVKGVVRVVCVVFSATPRDAGVSPVFCIRRLFVP